MSTELEQLARWRTVGARHSEEVVEMAQKVLRAGGTGDQEWSIREQLAIAALDLGQIEVAVDNLQRLRKQFPLSPRVAIIHGLRLEARGNPEGAKAVYEALLQTDECNISAHQRLIALSLSTPGTPVSQTITLLINYLNTFYSDPAGWSLLAELYANSGMYAQSMAALGHLMLIQTWDSGAVIRAAETAYTMGDFQLALKFFLRATEMQTESTGNEPPTKTRSWWGVKLSIRRLLAETDPTTSVPSETRTTPAQLQALEQLATERLLAAGGKGLEVRRKVLGGQTTLR